MKYKLTISENYTTYISAEIPQSQNCHINICFRSPIYLRNKIYYDEMKININNRQPTITIYGNYRNIKEMMSNQIKNLEEPTFNEKTKEILLNDKNINIIKEILTIINGV